MHVDPPGSDVGAIGVERLPGLSGNFAHLGDHPVLDGDVARVGLSAQAVDDGGVPDQVIVHGCSSSVDVPVVVTVGEK